MTFMGQELDENGDIKGAIPFFEHTQKIADACVEATNRLVLQEFVKLNIDPEIVEKQLEEIQMLKMKVEKMKCCDNCKFGNIRLDYYIPKPERDEAYKICMECDAWNRWELYERQPNKNEGL